MLLLPTPTLVIFRREFFTRSPFSRSSTCTQLVHVGSRLFQDGPRLLPSPHPKRAFVVVMLSVAPSPAPGHRSNSPTQLPHRCFAARSIVCVCFAPHPVARDFFFFFSARSSGWLFRASLSLLVVVLLHLLQLRPRPPSTWNPPLFSR